MKNVLMTTLAAFLFLAVSCQKPEEIWEDNANPEIFIPGYGYSFVPVWDVTSGVYKSGLGVSCGGVRPNNQKQEITVSYAVDNSMVDAYNADITKQYQGEILALPADCYKVSGTSVVMAPGVVETRIPIDFNLAAIKSAAAANPGKRLVLPVRLTGTSKYSLSATEGLTECLMEVNIKEPTFYFQCNNYGRTLKSTKLIYGTKDNVYKFDIMAEGVPDGKYDITLAYDPEALAACYPGATILPEDAVVLKNETVYRNSSNHAYLEFELIPEKIDFFTTYYLPVSIKSASEYRGDENLGKFFMTVEMKNEFEKTYSGIYLVSNVEYDPSMPNKAGAVTRSAGLSSKVTTMTYSEDTYEMNVVCKGSIAGTTYNYNLMRVKVIPTDNKSHYNVEIIPVSDKEKKYNSPAELSPDTERESYYDWNEEKFILNYRWKHIARRDTSWYYVQLVLQAD